MSQISKYLKEVQGYSFRCCLELDHALAKARSSIAALEAGTTATSTTGTAAATGGGGGGSVSRVADKATDATVKANLITTYESIEEEVLDDIGGVLWRFVYNRRDENEFDSEHIMLMAKYVREEQLSLRNISIDALNNGCIKWGPLPAWKRRTGKHSSSSNNSSSNSINKNISSAKSSGVEASSTSSTKENESVDNAVDGDDDESEDEWKQALTPDGKHYYWNTLTKQTTWEKPPGFRQ